MKKNELKEIGTERGRRDKIILVWKRGTQNKVIRKKEI